MARALHIAHKRLSTIALFLKNPNIFPLPNLYDVSSSSPFHIYSPSLSFSQFKALRWYARKRPYDIFGGKLPRDAKESRKEFAKKMESDEDCLWTETEGESDDDGIKKAKRMAKGGDKIDADDSEELWGEWSGSDEEETFWTGSEVDDDDYTPPESQSHERSDSIDKLFEFQELPKDYSLDSINSRALLNALDAAEKEVELSPGQHARKLAVQKALKKLKKGPDGHYINVWEVMSDVDILIGAFENIISGPEYEELKSGGPKKLNMQFFKDIQTRMRDPNFRWSPEIKLKPKSRWISRKEYEKTVARRRKARMR